MKNQFVERWKVWCV